MSSLVHKSLYIAVLVSSWGLRWNAYVFLRLLPFASRFMPKIWTWSAVFISTICIAASRPKDSKKRRRWSVSLCLGLLGGIDGTIISICSAVLVNIVMVLMCLDFCYRTTWYPVDDLKLSRTGYVTPSTANLLFRSESAEFNLTYSSANLGAHTTQVKIPDDTDSTISVHLEGLVSATTYTYFSTAGHQGTFRTADPDPKSFSLLSTSCQKPNWPYNPANPPLRITGLEYMDKYVAETSLQPEMMLFLGDFIYSDLPLPLAPYTRSYYRQLYRQIYASPSWTRRLLDIPWIHMFDDHEIINDYSTDPVHAPLYPEAIDAFGHYQLSVNPPPLDPTSPTYTSWNIGKIAFFLLDNRSFRSAQPPRGGRNSTGGYGERTMLGGKQLQAVQDWVELEGSRNGRLLVLVSGVPITRNWSEGGDEFDSWAGYLDERQEILEAMWSIGGGIVISGDRHEHATTLLPPPIDSPYPHSSALIEFSTSPLSFFHQPWLREHVQHAPTDLTLHHEWKGMSRFGVFDFDTTGDRLGVEFRLIVDGQEEWRYEWWKGKAVEIGM